MHSVSMKKPRETKMAIRTTPTLLGWIDKLCGVRSTETGARVSRSALVRALVKEEAERHGVR